MRREQLPAEWLHLICPHEWPDKEYRPTNSYLSESWRLCEIRMQVCACLKFEPRALNVCSRCTKLKPINFAHPAKCCVPYNRMTFICWDCIEAEGLTKCPCKEDENRDFTGEYGAPITENNSWYKALLRTIPPPAEFQPIVIDEDALFAELGIEL